MENNVFPVSVIGVYGALVAYGLYQTGSPYVLIALAGYAFILSAFNHWGEMR